MSKRSAGEIERWLLERLAGEFDRAVGEIDPLATFADFGLASVEVVGLVGDLEEWLGEPVGETATYDWPTPRALARALAGAPRDAVAVAEQAPGVAAGPIAIIGLACRFPGGGDDPARFWQRLLAATDAVTEVPAQRWDVDRHYDPQRSASGASYTRHGAFLADAAGWDAGFFGCSPQEALRTDPQQRLLMELVWEALEDAGIPAPTLAGSRTGLVVGLMDTGQYTRLQLDRHGRACVADPHFGLGAASSVAAGRLAHQLDLRGPAFTVDTACSSSLVATHLAAQSLARGEVDLAIVGGVSVNVHPDFHVQACAMSMLSPDGRCKTFDERADGFAMGEGGGVVVLARPADAERAGRRVHALVRGSAVNQDGRSNGLTAPNRVAQVAVIRDALRVAGRTPDEVDFVEAHGSGTGLGDAIELSALHDVFGGRPAERPLLVGAVKTNIGHTLAAAGMAGLIKTVLALRHGELPPNLHLERPADAIPADGTIRPLTSRATWPPDRRVAGVSSFGWSGTNAHVVLESAPAAGPGRPGTPGQLLTLSAHTPTALAEQAARLADALADGTELADVAYTLQTGRARLGARRAILCHNVEDARTRLRDAGLAATPVHGAERPTVAYLLPGVGEQHLGMAARLHATEPAFAEAFDLCADVLRDHYDVDIASVLTAAPSVGAGLATLLGRGSEAPVDERLTRAELVHPLVFSVEYALARLLAAWGVEPDALLGYSLGEYTAACLAGVFTVDDAVHVVVERARLVARQPAGGMLAVAADEERTTTLLRGIAEPVSVAALNGPTMTVLSGTERGLAAAAERSAEHGVASRPLRTTHAFHSPLLEPARDALAEVIASVRRRPNQVPVVSNVTGTWLTAAQAMNPEYWADHLCRPVRFADGARLLADRDVVVEVGPGTTLGALLRQNDVAPAGGVLATLPSALAAGQAGQDDRDTVLHTLGRLWELGAEIDWTAVHHDRRMIVELPTYPFQRTRFWPDAVPGTDESTADSRGDWCYAATWQRDPGVPAAVTPAGPLVVFCDPFGVGAALAGRARQAGGHTVEVHPGTARRRDGTRVEIDPADPEHYRAVLADIPGEPTVVHAWSLQHPAAGDLVDRAGATIADGFTSLLLLARALGDTLPDAPVRLLTVSAGTADVLGDDATTPERALVHGLGRVLPAEYPALRWQGVDLDPRLLDPEQAADQLLAELGGPAADADADGVAAWRHGRRWQRTWRRLDLPNDAATPWRPEGAYLITGGTRGLGMLLAEHLARAGVRRLALVARTAAPDDPAAAELRAAGVDVLVLRADAGVPAELRAAVRTAREHFGALHGIVHCAGVPGAGMVQRKEVADAERVLAPKVLGGAALSELVGPDVPADERLELLVLYSSSVTVLGGLGEGDYCAANTALDAYAAGGTRVVSVAWGPWRHDAWQAVALAGAPRLAELAARYRADYGFGDREGVELLDRIVASGRSNVLALRQPLLAAREFWAKLADVESLTTPATQDPARYPRPSLRTVWVPPRTDLEHQVAAVWERFLGIDGIGVDDPFFDLGGNSLVGTALVRALGQELGRPFAPAVLFQHPTVADLTRWFAESRSDGTTRADEAMAISSARGERRRQLRDRKRGHQK